MVYKRADFKKPLRIKIGTVIGMLSKSKLNLNANINNCIDNNNIKCFRKYINQVHQLASNKIVISKQNRFSIYSKKSA